MTTVHIDLRAGTGVPAEGSISWRPTLAVTQADKSILLPAPVSTVLSGGTATLDVPASPDLPGAAWCWQVVESITGPGGASTRILRVAVPDSDETVEYADLPRVETLAPGVSWQDLEGLAARAEDAADRADEAAGAAATDAVADVQADVDAQVTAAQTARTGAEAARDTAVQAAEDAATARDAAAATAADALASQQAAHTDAATATEQAGAAAASAGQAATVLASAVQYKGSLGTQDLNTILTPGVYYQDNIASATVERNYPGAFGGALEVVARGTFDILQRYTPMGSTYSGRGAYQRTIVVSTGAATPWRFIPTQRVDTTAGRAIYTWDDVSNREQLIYSDTGWRDISSSLINGWVASILRIRRSNCWNVEYRILGLNGSNATDPKFLAIPDGFRDVGNNGVFVAAKSTDQMVGVQMDSATTSLALPIGASYFTAYAGRFGYSVAQAWPTTLPGTAVGTIPNL